MKKMNFGVALFVSSFLWHGSVQACTSLKVSGDHASAPLMWYNGKGFEGYAFQVIREISKELDVKIQEVNAGPWKRVLRSLEKGSIDVVVALHKNEERAKKFLYSDFYIKSRVLAYTSRVSNLQIESKDDLIKLEGVAPRGMSFGQELDKYMTDHFKIWRTQDSHSAMKMVAEGRADYGLSINVAQHHLIEENIQTRNFKIHENLLEGEGIYLAFSKNSPCKKYLAQVNALIADWKMTGHIKKLTHLEYPTPIDDS